MTFSKWPVWFRLHRKRIGRFWQWIADRLHQRNHQIVVAMAIGLVAGLVAVILKWSTHSLRDWVYGDNPSGGNLGFFILPGVGIAVTAFYLRRILRKPFSTGLSPLVHAISSKRINIPRHEMYSHVVTTSLTVGFGGSVGMEAPIVRTGAAIGANLARILRAGRNQETLFLACGAAAGIASIFNSPVAGVLFAFEVLLPGVASIESFIPLLIAAATGTVVGRSLYYEQLFFLPSSSWTIADVPFFILLGALCGLLSVYMMRMNAKTRDVLEKIKKPYVRIAVGSLVLGGLIFLFPPLFGEGYDTVNLLLRGDFREVLGHSLFYDYSRNTWVVLGFVAVVMLLKIVAFSVTINSGGNGGIFAPSMVIGSTLGFLFAHGVNELGWVILEENNYIGVAMAGILSGVFKSPLTGIFLIAEVTGGYSLFVPLMVVAAISYFVSYYFEPFAMHTRELHRKGLWVPPHKQDLVILKNLRLSDMLETDFSVLSLDNNLGEMVNVIAQSKRNVFPVIDEKGGFAGIVLLDDVRELMFNPELYNRVMVRDLAHQPPAVLQAADSMDRVMRLFEAHGAWNLPVVADGKYLGFVSKSTVFNRYREALQGLNTGFG
ncbi:MAG: chloride channel protein [Haliscomenobacter sp.]|nr:chloride channel protein [Haliscomenobacter sp.]MBK8877165.1 chloride channel protein [Haliscomenobacter sp.]